MPRAKRVIESALRLKGFAEAEGDHRYFVYITRGGLKTRARTKTSHSPKARDVPDHLLGQMARQCLLTRDEFLNLVDCPLDRDGYERRLIEQGEIPPEPPSPGG